MDNRDDLRASDADRQHVGDRLREAVNEGRLTLTEYDERLEKAYSARTYGDLNGLLADLPPVGPAGRSQLARTVAETGGADLAPQHERSLGWLAGIWGGWLSTSTVCTAIWGLTAIGSTSVPYFWPIWVIGPWGAMLLMGTARSLAAGGHRRSPGPAAIAGDDQRYDQRDDRRARRRERRSGF